MGKWRASRRVRPAHLIYHHSERVTIRFASWEASGTGWRIQQLRAHPTNCPPGGSSFGQENRAQIGHGHEAEIGNTSGTRVVDEDIRLSRLSVKQRARKERCAHSFKIPMNDFEFVEVGHARGDLGELKAIDEQEK